MKVGSRMGKLEVVESYPSFEARLQLMKHEFIKDDFMLEKSPLLEFVHVTDFV